MAKGGPKASTRSWACYLLPGGETEKAAGKVLVVVPLTKKACC